MMAIGSSPARKAARRSFERATGRTSHDRGGLPLDRALVDGQAVAFRPDWRSDLARPNWAALIINMRPVVEVGRGAVEGG